MKGANDQNIILIPKERKGRIVFSERFPQHLLMGSCINRKL